MADSTIPDALAADLRDYFLAAQPAGLDLPADSVRLRHGTTEPPVPRLVIITADPKNVPRMEGTAKIAVRVEYLTSMDRVSPEAHQVTAGHLDAWWRGLRSARRRAVIATRVYMHDVSNGQAAIEIRSEGREQLTTLRGEFTVTLATL